MSRRDPGINGRSRAAISRILLPLDGSAESRTAIEPALRVARPLAVPLELITVVDRVGDRWARDIDDVAAGVGYDQVDVVCVGSGWAGNVIAELAAEHPGAIVCMATHNRDRLFRLMAGSVTQHVIRTAPCPVLTVGPAFRPKHGGVPKNRQPYRRAVVCLDGGQGDRWAVELAHDWGRRLGLELDLVHVSADHGPGTQAFEAQLLRTAETLTRDGLTVTVTVTVTVGDDPAARLADLLSRRADAIAVLARPERSSVSRLLLGSVSSALLEISRTPLLLTRPRSA